MSAGDQVIYVASGGTSRRYVLHVPPSYDGSRAWPLLLMLDGRGGTPWTAIKITGWSAKADAAEFLVAYPEAMKLDPHGPQHFLTNPQMWNAGTGGSDVERTGPDDVQFLRDAIADIRAKFNVDGDRIYMAGFSNGASMTFRFALEAPDVVAAIACLSGHFRMTGFVNPFVVPSQVGQDGSSPMRSCATTRCERTTNIRPVPLIYFFGERDPLSHFHGGEVELPWGKREVRPSAQHSVDAWADVLGLPPLPRTESHGGITKKTYGPRDDGAEVQFYSIDDLGHVWPGGHRLLPEKIAGSESRKLIANDVIWEFFAARPKRRA